MCLLQAQEIMIYYSFIKDYSGFAVFLLCIVLKMFISPGFGLLVEKKNNIKMFLALTSAGIHSSPCGLSLWQREDGQLPAEEPGEGQR